ncbi:MAG: hypothetical protein V2A56_13005, partial [bacterium]
MKIPAINQWVLHLVLAIVMIAGMGWGSASASSSAMLTASGTVVGYVEDAVSGEPLGWVDVVVEELKTAAQTGPDGFFHLSHIPPGTWSVRSIRIG